MVAIINPFDAGGYSLAEMTQAINILPNVYTRLGQMTVTLHEAYLALAKTPIQGPAGVQATFDLRAAYNAAAGCMMTVTLRNDVAEYA